VQRKNNVGEKVVLLLLEEANESVGRLVGGLK
jgi:hypothetical protein